MAANDTRVFKEKKPLGADVNKLLKSQRRSRRGGPWGQAA
jgi:hypothetical protein